LEPAVTVVMFCLGLLLGFVGLGGAGWIALLLMVLFQVPVHLAFGTALGAMFFAAVSGGWSHLREGNVDPVAGVEIGVAGILGAYIGGGLALATAAPQLKTVAGLLLMINGVLLFLRTRAKQHPYEAALAPAKVRWRRELPRSVGVGLGTGVMTGYFSIGSAPWIQLGLMVFNKLDLRRTIGTAMLALALISLTGAIRFAQGGQFDAALLASVVIGVSAGTFIGAKLTRRAPRPVVRSALIMMPLMAGALLVLTPTPG
jgi:uncharacterized protein